MKQKNHSSTIQLKLVESPFHEQMTYFCHKFTLINRELRLAYFCLAGISIVWGTTFMVMRVGVMDFPPFLFAGLRQFIAGIILATFLVVVKKVKLPPLSQWGRHVVGGFLMITLGNGLVSWAEVYVPSGVAAIICSFMPVWVTIINLTINRDELPNGKVILGVLIGMVGILMVFNEHLAAFVDRRYQLGIFFVFVASLAWAMGSIIIKRSPSNSNPFLNAALQMVLGGAGCIVLSAFFDDLSQVHWTSTSTYSLAYLVLVGSVGAFAMYVYALTKLPITIASLYSYINPLVAVLLGWIALDEKFNTTIAIAMIVTIGGIYLVNQGYRGKVVPKN